MMWFAAALAIAAAGGGFWIIEKRREAGTLTYPLWRGNLLIPWSGLAVLFVLLMSAQELPRALSLANHGMQAQGNVVKMGDYCKVDYTYKVSGKDYTGIGSKCGLKAGSTCQLFYDPASPDYSTLYQPKGALRDTLIAIALISVGLPTFIVGWLMLMNVIGMRKRS